MTNPIHFKNAAFTFGGGATMKAAKAMIPSYDVETVTITLSLLFMGIFILCKELSSDDITKMVIGMIALNITDVLKVEPKLACGFNAFVILILGLMSVKGNQEQADEKKKK